MKRTFTFLMSALFLCMGMTVKAQTFPEVSTAEAPKYYTIASFNRGGYLTNVGQGKGVEHIATTQGSIWYFTQADENGGLHFCNFAGGYLAADKTVSETAGVWYVLANGVNTEGVSISSTNPISGSSCIDANNSNTGVGAWSPSASDWHGTTWVFAEVTDFSAIFNVDEAKAAAKAEIDVLASESAIYSGDAAAAKANVDAVQAEGTSAAQLVAAIEAVNQCVVDFKNVAYQALEGKYFTFSTPARSNGFMKLDGNRVIGLAEASSPAAVWQFVYADNAVKVFNPYTGKYLGEPGGSSADVPVAANAEDAAAYQLVINDKAEKAEAKVKFTSNGKSVHMAGGSVLVRWDNGGASEWTVTEISEFSGIVSLHKAAALAAVDAYSTLPEIFETAAAKEAINAVSATDWSAFAAIDEAANSAIPTGIFAFQATSGDNHRDSVWVSANMETSKAIGAVEQDANAHWTLKPANGGAFYIYNVKNGLYMGNPGGNCVLTESPAAAYTVEVIDAEKNVVEFKCSGQTLHASNHADDKLMNYDGDEAASRWTIVAMDDFYNLNETIEGEWADVTNAGAWPIIDHAELLGLGDYWVATNNTNYDAERGVMEFVAGENTSASLIQEYCPFGQATYRLTGKAFHKGATNAVLFVGDQTVEIPAAAEGATFENAEEHFTTFSIEFTCEAAWGTQLTVGYSCEFDSADDFLVVGGLKLEEKKSTTLRDIFESTIISCESLGWEIMQMSALHAQQQAVMATAMPIYEALMGNQKVLKAEVEQSIAEMEAVIATLSPVAVFYKGDFSDALWAAEELMWEFDEESEEYAMLEAAVTEASNVAAVTTIADLEAKIAALQDSIEPLYNLDETIEGEWVDVTNAAPGEWAIIDHAELLGLGDYWVATNNTNYDEERGVMEFVAGENTEASLIQEYCPFGKATYRLTGKAFHNGAVNAVLFVGDQKVEIPAAAEGATFENAEEHFTTFSIEFTCEAAWGTQLTVGYSCEFDNAEDFLVVGGLKLEEKKSTTLRDIFESTIISCESLGWEIMQMSALHAQQQAVMATAMPIYEALMGNQKVLKAEVEQSIAEMEAVIAELSPVAEYYKGDFSDALWAAEELKWELDEESEPYATLDAAITEASNVAAVTTIADLEAKIAALQASIESLYNLDETIEGEWVDVTNAAPGEWAIIDHAELLGLGDYWVATNNTNYDAERGVMEFVAGENTEASLIQEYCPFGKATYRLTGKAFHNGAVNAVLFVGDQKVEIPAAAEGATFENAEEHFTTFSIEFTCEAAWGTQLTVGYSCEFDNAEDFLVVGGLKLEEKSSTTLRGLFEETIMACESLGWEIMQMSALHAQQQAVMATAMPIYEALKGNQKVLKAEVEQSIAEMEAVIAELSPVAEYYKGDFSDALWAAEELKWEFDEESEEYADLDAAINEANNVAEVTTVAELEAKLEALKVVVELIETGIENVEAETETVIYDLNGRRVTEMTKGIYIVNGKKVVIK